jgi:hypothetical protein
MMVMKEEELSPKKMDGLCGGECHKWDELINMTIINSY